MPVLSDLMGGGGFELIDSQTLTTSGTWTKPAGVKDNDIVVVDLWGGGGSGACSTNQYSTAGAGAAHNRMFIPASVLASSETVTVAAGGVPVSASGTEGNPGGTSSFGSYGDAHGGGGGAVGSDHDVGAGGGGILGAGQTGESDSNIVLPGGPQGAVARSVYASAAGKWGGGSPSPTSGGDGLQDGYHGGGAASTHSRSKRGGNSMWGGAAGGTHGSFDAVTLPGLSKYGGDGGSSGNGAPSGDGQIPGGGGGSQNTNGQPSGAGARGEVRVYVVRGAIPPEDFVFEV